MKVGIIGTPNKDTLILPGGAKVGGWGGIVYNILTLAHYLRDSGTVHPICPVGADSKDDFLALLKKSANVKTEGVKLCAQPQNRVILKCASHEEKVETAKLSLPALAFDFIKTHLEGLDFLLVNFTSGRDVTKETLRQIRDKYKGPIIVDVHSLTLSDPDAQGKRRLQPFKDWQEWLQGMEYVQFSWREAVSLTHEGKQTFGAVVEVADWLLHNGSTGVIVTRGAQGSLYFHADEQGILKHEIPPLPLQTIMDTTGCGDVFSSSLIYQILTGHNGIEAAEFATKAASLKATFSGIGPWIRN